MPETPPRATSFYDLFRGAERRVLSFFGNAEDQGPFWTPDGDVIQYPTGSLLTVELEVVDLGGGLFRLAENAWFDYLSELHWGDEFFADTIHLGALHIKRISLPLKFDHRMVLGQSLKINSIESNEIHAAGGGWDSLLNVCTIITLPINNLDQKND